MSKTYSRWTLKDSTTLEGRGLHSGEAVAVTLHPGKEGFVFRSGSERVAAVVENVTDTSRCTRLGSISTVEHVLSALAGMGVTDAEIEVAGGELPAAGGCSAPYVSLIQQTGLEECGSLEVSGPFERVYLKVDGAMTSYAMSLGEGYWRNVYELPGYDIGRQEFEMVWSPEIYAKEVAPARTLVLDREIEMARAAGLGQGLDEGSVLGIGTEGYLNEARFADEPVRHKLLDMIGDLALTGIPVAHLDVVGEWTGHKFNVDAAAKLASAVKVIRS